MKNLMMAGLLSANMNVQVLSQPTFWISSAESPKAILQPEIFCSELNYNYQQERAELNKVMTEQAQLKDQLSSFNLPSQNKMSFEDILKRLSELNLKLKDQVNKLNALALPQFTDMKYEVEIIWEKPVEPLHFDDHYSRIKDKIKADGLGSYQDLSDHELKIYRNGSPFTVINYELNYMYFAGEEFKEIIQSFYLDTGLNMSKRLNKKSNHYFRIRKAANKIEICQLLNRLEIGLEVAESVKHEFSDGENLTHKQIYLKF